MFVASFEFFAKRIHRGYLIRADTLYVNVHREPDVAVTQNSLDSLIVTYKGIAGSVLVSSCRNGSPSISLSNRVTFSRRIF
jgi:hypothetical protein